MCRSAFFWPVVLASLVSTLWCSAIAGTRGREETLQVRVTDLIDLGVRVLMEKPPNAAVLTTRVDHLLALRRAQPSSALRENS